MTGDHPSVPLYGNPDAAHTLDVFEDLRCSYCAELEHALGATMLRLADEGTYRIRFNVANFLDRGDDTGPSTTALAALGTAAQQGLVQFVTLREAVLEHRFTQGSADLSDVETLVGIAAERAPEVDVQALRAVLENGTYRDWAVRTGAESFSALKAMWTAAGLEGRVGTPAVFLDGKPVETVTGEQETPVSPETFAANVAAVLAAR